MALNLSKCSSVAASIYGLPANVKPRKLGREYELIRHVSKHFFSEVGFLFDVFGLI